MNTKKLYEIDPYLESFTAKVIACEQSNDVYHVQLDATCFFPESGGQSGDRGTLGGKKVFETQISDNTIFHIMKEPLTVGEVVEGKIDWDRRFDFMQHHTGEHIFSGIAYEKYGAVNVGFHLSDQTVTLDLDRELSQADLYSMEQAVNQVIWNNHTISTAVYDSQDMEQMNYRSKKNLEGEVRLVTIQQVDCCACCAPHLKQTGQVGSFLIQSWEKYKGGIRLRILCGKRAVEDYRKLSLESSKLCNLFSSKPEQLSDQAILMQCDVITKKRQLDDLQLKYANLEISMMENEQPFILYETEEMDGVLVKRLLQNILEKNVKVAFVLVGRNKEEYRFYASGNEVNLKELLEQLKQQFTLKGGGSKDLIQGSIVIGKSELFEFLQNFLNE